MPLALPSRELTAAHAEQRAIAAFSVYNLEQVQAICAAAEETGEPVMIQAGSSSFTYSGEAPLIALAKAAAEASGATLGLHLDHSRDLEEIRRCLTAGYTSVMFDGSAMDLAENERLTAQVVREAGAFGAWVEAELAGIGGDEDSSQANASATAMTDPDVAASFVEATGVAALAVAIGNVHGIPATPVHLDLERLAAIQAAVPVPLVLHGASGLEDAEVLGAIRLGVAKINVNTELRRALAAHLNDAPAGRDDLTSLLGPARDAMQAVASEKIRLYAAASAPAGS